MRILTQILYFSLFFSFYRLPARARSLHCSFSISVFFLLKVHCARGLHLFFKKINGSKPLLTLTRDCCFIYIFPWSACSPNKKGKANLKTLISLAVFCSGSAGRKIALALIQALTPTSGVSSFIKCSSLTKQPECLCCTT